MAKPDALHHITIQRWWLYCVTILLSDCLACLRLRLYRALLHHRRSRSLGPCQELEHSRNRLLEREARHHADLRTRSPRSDLSARVGARSRRLEAWVVWTPLASSRSPTGPSRRTRPVPGVTPPGCGTRPLVQCTGVASTVALYRSVHLYGVGRASVR